MDIAIILFEGFDELDAIGPFEIFENAARAGADCSVTLCTLDEQETVTASHGLTVEAGATLDELDPDVVVVPGGGWNDRSDTGVWAEAEWGEIPDAVAALYEDDVTVCAVCTGAMLLARAGLTDGRPAVTHDGALEDLRATDADVVTARVVDDGDLVTAGGVTSGFDLAFHLVRREFGDEVAETVATEMEYEPSDDVYREE